MPIDLNQFVLTDIIGEGGMAAVWRGVHRDTGDPVAVKLMHREASQNPERCAQFLAEAQAISGFVHPNIVPIYEYGHTGDASQGAASASYQSPYYVMPVYDRGTLNAGLWTQSWDCLKQTLVDVLSGLATIHGAGYVHRDLKPANVFRSNTGAVVGDFGIAHAMFSNTTDDNNLAGTPNFMAPEQIRRDLRALGAWTDVYAVGCMVYRNRCHTSFKLLNKSGCCYLVLAAILNLRPSFIGT